MLRVVLVLSEEVFGRAVEVQVVALARRRRRHALLGRSRRRRRGRLFAVALLRRLSHARHERPVRVDRVRLSRRSSSNRGATGVPPGSRRRGLDFPARLSRTSAGLGGPYAGPKERANPSHRRLLVTYRPLAYAGYRIQTCCKARSIQATIDYEQNKRPSLTRAAATARASASAPPSAARSARPRRRGRPSRSWGPPRRRAQSHSRRPSSGAEWVRRARATP